MDSSSSAFSAWRDGWRRVLGAPALILGVYLLTLTATVPLALVLRADLSSQLGRSARAGEIADGVRYDWWQEFLSQATGLGTTFTPSVIGFAATLDNISSLADARARPLQITAAIVFYLSAWAFLSGGIIDRYARQRPTRAHGFFAAAGVFFFRFLRLAILAGFVYWLLFAYVHIWLFETFFTWVTRDLSVERTAFAWRLGCYAAFGALLLGTNILVDYAKVRAVVEDRRSMLGALLASVRFVARHPRRTFGLYALGIMTFLALLGVWMVIAPGVTGTGAAMWMAFGVGQAYIVARLLLKLQIVASHTALFQRALAHAAYASAPDAVWPESPAAEAIVR